jgi:hypothetical protein
MENTWENQPTDADRSCVFLTERHIAEFCVRVSVFSNLMEEFRFIHFNSVRGWSVPGTPQKL